MINLIEIYESVQGETSFVGLPTTFIRTAGCNLRCVWCDTPYSFGRGTPFSCESILNEVEKLGHRYVCVTGGEPLLHDEIYSLMKELSDRGFIVSIETGGSLPIKDIDLRVKIILDLKCPGSKMDHKNDLSNLAYLKASDEVKFVILDRKDYEWAKEYLHRLPFPSILFSPEHTHLDPKDLVKWILEDHLPVRLNLQLHKYIWDKETRSV